MDDDLLYVERLDDYRSLCISPLSQESIAEEGAENLGGGNGYYIYEIDESPLVSGVAILAKAASLDAAFRLIEIWRNRVSIS